MLLLGGAALGIYLYERDRTGSIYHPNARFVPENAISDALQKSELRMRATEPKSPTVYDRQRDTLCNAAFSRRFDLLSHFREWLGC